MMFIVIAKTPCVFIMCFVFYIPFFLFCVFCSRKCFLFFLFFFCFFQNKTKEKFAEEKVWIGIEKKRNQSFFRRRHLNKQNKHCTVFEIFLLLTHGTILNRFNNVWCLWWWWWGMDILQYIYFFFFARLTQFNVETKMFLSLFIYLNVFRFFFFLYFLLLVKITQ